MPALLLRFLPHIILVVSALGIIGWFYAKGRLDVTRAIEVKNLRVTMDDQEELNEIRNNRPDDASLIDSLRSGDF